MKIKHLLYAVAFTATMSCSSAFEEPLDSIGLESDIACPVSRSINIDTIEEEPELLHLTDEMLSLKEMLDNLRRPARLSASLYNNGEDEDDEDGDYNYDMYYDSNLRAIEGIPMYIRVRKAGATSLANRVYMSTDGEGKEINLRRSSEIDDRFRFILKRPLSVTGIPYLIYSYKTNTPVAVGAYKSNPDKKVLMLAKDDTDLLPCSWDLIPADSAGCFYIQSQSYIGRTDPNNYWSIFYYVLEAMDDNRARFAKIEYDKPEQIFYFDLNAEFAVKSIEYDFNSAVVTPAKPLRSNELTLRNTSDFDSRKDFTVTAITDETSDFKPRKSQFVYKINGGNLLPRPRTEAKVAFVNPDTPRDANYNLRDEKFTGTLTYSGSVYIMGRASCKLIIEFQTFDLEVPYVLTATYQGKDIKLCGVWRGHVIGDPECDVPTQVTIYRDLDTGEIITPLNASLRKKK